MILILALSEKQAGKMLQDLSPLLTGGLCMKPKPFLPHSGAFSSWGTKVLSVLSISQGSGLGNWRERQMTGLAGREIEEARYILKWNNDKKFLLI